ncbi:MAG: hypothetical protein MUE92_04885 [Chloroflexi bacterium]|nr:hypothetical protein [Chloroflexota bacterium]
MSKRHQASRRRTYARRQHEVRERRERSWRSTDADRELVEDGFAPAEGTAAELRAPAYGATWIGLE